MNIKKRTNEILKSLYGNEARFREGQYEAIEATLTNKRTLVVQRTGWGKSLIYFCCTKLLREQGRGLTLVVSPLLVLMQNQIEAAEKLNLKCESLNSETKDKRQEIFDQMVNSELDLVLVTPETLFKDDIQSIMKDIRIGLFVIDEAHCISDWGHDFRLEYGKLKNIINMLPSNVPILATTATANDRVVNDLKEQLGGDVFVSRGPLSRESLAIQVIKMKDRADRYSWLIKNINKLPGSGIIYCLTQRDCDYLSDFLIKNGIKAMPYYSSIKHNDRNSEAMQKFYHNEIKAIVATVKLGMGYDKGDIGFVIHFQQPSNIVSYYQQIGRAGRNIDIAFVFLMSGKEDEEIIDYFINTAFPTKVECDNIITAIQDSNGIGLYSIIKSVNMKKSRIEKALNFLDNEGAIFKDKSKYFVTANKYLYNEDHYNKIKQIRIKEKNQMQELINTRQCYSKFIVNCLDDNEANECGKCSNCLGQELIDSKISLKDKEAALSYINSLLIAIEPRKQWAMTQLTKQSKIDFINEEGICISKYGDVGYGELVKRDKYQKKAFCEELIGKSVQVLKPIVRDNQIKHITYVPSLRSSMVEDFAKRLAESLKIELVHSLIKKEASQQKTMENSSFQCYNALNSFIIKEGVLLPEKVILVDDIIDSKWTITVCGYKLMEQGVKCVFPFALADSSQQED